MKFRGQPSLFPNETSKVMYAASHLDGPPFAWFTPLNERFNRGEIPSEFTSFEAFVDALTVLYGDPYLKQTAERDLRALLQTTSVSWIGLDESRNTGYAVSNGRTKNMNTRIFIHLEAIDEC